MDVRNELTQIQPEKSEQSKTMNPETAAWREFLEVSLNAARVGQTEFFLQLIYQTTATPLDAEKQKALLAVVESLPDGAGVHDLLQGIENADSEVLAPLLAALEAIIYLSKENLMGPSIGHSPAQLTDDKVASAARPGESWEQARERLRAAADNQSALSGREWQRFVYLIDDIQRVSIKWLHDSKGRDAKLLLNQVQNLFEYCCALSENRAVELVPLDQLRYGLFEEAYGVLSSLNSDETEWLPECFIGLLDVLSHPEPYDYLLSLEADGCLKMVLNG